MNKGKFTIDCGNVTERDVIENCLNLKHSGCDPHLTLAFYALGNSWHYEKLIYYLNLITEEHNSALI
jgi:hypothetical protein